MVVSDTSVIASLSAEEDGMMHVRTNRVGKITNWLLPVLVVLGLAGVVVFRSGKGSPVPAYFDKSMSLTAARVKAEKEGKAVVALVTADWCGPCQTLKRGALSDSSVAAFMSERVVPVYVDVTSSTPADAAGLNVSAIPTVVVLKGDQELGRFTGPQPADNVLAFLQQAVGK